MSTPEGPKRAAALRYEQGAGAPKVTAAGKGMIAERILEEARKAGVPIREDKALAEALSGLDLGSEVPEDLWVAVAQAIAWAYRLDLRAR